MLMTRLAALALTLFALGAFAGRDASALTLSFAPSALSAGIGDPILVDVVVSDLGTDLVAGFDLDVTYDASVLTATGVGFGLNLGDPAAFEAFTDVILAIPGTVDFAEVSLLDAAQLAALQTGPSFTLATLQFDVIGAGVSPLAYRLDANNLIVGPPGNVLDVVVRGGSVVAVVPEPTAALLFAVGVVFAGLQTRRARVA
jgi:hypothetical protein